MKIKIKQVLLIFLVFLASNGIVKFVIAQASDPFDYYDSAITKVLTIAGFNEYFDISINDLIYCLKIYFRNLC